MRDTVRSGVTINTHDVPLCPLCEASGTFIYRHQTDPLFGVPGKYNLKQCGNKDCRLIWLNPCPSAGDIGKLYQTYYTHENKVASMIGSGSSSRQAFKKAMFTQALGYHWADQGHGITSLAGRLLALNRYHRERLERSVMWLRPEKHLPEGNKSQPQLLDIGCGSGDFMVCMQEMNWQVHGIEPDDSAAEIGRISRGLNVTTGIIEDVNLPKDFYDAITLSHVVEHLTDPLTTLTKAFSLLKSGGKISIVTPNNQSLIHGLMGENWRGLEVPRHLQIFALQSLTSLVDKAGFTISISRTYSGTASSLWARSAAIKAREQFPDENPNDAYGKHFRLKSELMGLWEFFLTGWPLKLHSGEELVVVGRKP